MDNLQTIDWDSLDNISYRTTLGKSLKNTLRKFDKMELLEEVNDAITFFTEHDKEIKSEHRIKSLHSCLLKYEKYFPSTEVEKTFNDILGIRIVINEYSILDKMDFPKQVKIADMRNGKAVDDGYRGVHMYYQKDHHHYPIEIQFMTAKDRQFNEWLHIYFYKYVKDTSIGATLRKLYDNGTIQSEEEFKKEMKKYVLSGC